MSRRIIGVLAGLLLAVALTACGDSDDDTAATGDQKPSEATEAFPVTIDGVTIEEQPTAIVSMSPSATETLFAIGAGDQVIAVDQNSNYPPEAPKGDLDAYKPNVEAIAAKEPDLVVVSDDLNDVVKGLTALKIPVLIESAPSDVEGVYAEIEELGKATGHAAEAAELADGMRDDIESVVEQTDAEGLTFYYEIDDNYYSQTSNTFLGKLLGLLGLVNIADGAGGASDYPQLSAEHIIKSDPDLILLSDTKYSGQSAKTVAACPGWGDLKALTHDGVVELDDDVAQRWGPRVVDLFQQVAAAAEKVKAAA